jgi:hypothetical protein
MRRLMARGMIRNRSAEAALAAVLRNAFRLRADIAAADRSGQCTGGCARTATVAATGLGVSVLRMESLFDSDGPFPTSTGPSRCWRCSVVPLARKALQ